MYLIIYVAYMEVLNTNRFLRGPTSSKIHSYEDQPQSGDIFISALLKVAPVGYLLNDINFDIVWWRASRWRFSRDSKGLLLARKAEGILKELTLVYLYA